MSTRKEEEIESITPALKEVAQSGPVKKGDRVKARGKDEHELKYGAADAIKLVVPISITMTIVIVLMKLLCPDFSSCEDTLRQRMFTVFNEAEASSDTARLGLSLVNALVIVGVIFIMTVIMVTCVYFNCLRCIYGYMLFAIFVMLTFITSQVVKRIAQRFNFALDWVTLAFFIFNYAVCGLIAIFWKAPLLLQQAYLILKSSMLAYNLILWLPEWTSWTLLILLAIWDLIAVLWTYGPLRIMVNVHKKREEEGKGTGLPPGLLYSTMIWIAVVEMINKSGLEEEKVEDSERIENLNNESDVANEERKDAKQEKVKVEPKEEKKDSQSKLKNQLKKRLSAASMLPPEKSAGLKMGLGDFIFYSLLIGKSTAYGDANTIMACFVAILVGAASTLLLLAIYKHALPALPISIFFGVIFYFSTKIFVSPFLDLIQFYLIYI